MPHKIVYRRRLPHIQPAEGTYSITYRLAGSLPRSVIQKQKEVYQINKNEILDRFKGKEEEALAKEALAILRHDHYEKMDRYLGQVLHGPNWLSDPTVAKIIMDSLHFIEQKFKYWTIWSYCIMSNHVHLECTLTPAAPALNLVMKSHKSFTALQSNRYLGREGRFWQEESFDRLIRDDNDFYRRIYYTIYNPVEAKLVKNWQEWPYTYVHPGIRKEIETRTSGPH